MVKTERIIISGNVQGIFFRDFIKKSADALGLKGFTRNLENGKVEVVVEGRENEVEKMIAVCRKGAPHTSVRELEIQELGNQGYSEFKILHF